MQPDRAPLVQDRAREGVTVYSDNDTPIDRDLPVSSGEDDIGILMSKATLSAPTAPEQDCDIWIGHGANGGGILGRDGGMAHGAGEILEIILTDYSTIPLDVGRMRAYQPVLDAYRLDAYINEPIPAYGWVQRALLPLLPVRPAMSDEGLYFAPLRYRADASQVVVHLDADRRDVVRTSGVSPRFDLYNEFSIEAGKWRDGYAVTRTLTGDASAFQRGWWGGLADPRVMSDAWCRLSQSRYGRISADPIQTACLWDETTITQVLQDRAEKHALPILGCQYVARTSLALRRLTVGSVVALTDSDIALSEALCIVEDLAYSVDQVVLELSVLPGNS